LVRFYKALQEIDSTAYLRIGSSEHPKLLMSFSLLQAALLALNAKGRSLLE